MNNNQVLFDGPETINLRVKAIIDPGNARVVGMNIRGAKVIYDVEKQQLSLGNRKVSLEPQNGKIKLDTIVDAGMIEVFANDGLHTLIAISILALWNPANRRLLFMPPAEMPKSPKQQCMN